MLVGKQEANSFVSFVGCLLIARGFMRVESMIKAECVELRVRFTIAWACVILDIRLPYIS